MADPFAAGLELDVLEQADVQPGQVGQVSGRLEMRPDPRVLGTAVEMKAGQGVHFREEVGFGTGAVRAVLIQNPAHANRCSSKNDLLAGRTRTLLVRVQGSLSTSSQWVSSMSRACA